MKKSDAISLKDLERKTPEGSLRTRLIFLSFFLLTIFFVLIYFRIWLLQTFPDYDYEIRIVSIWIVSIYGIIAISLDMILVWKLHKLKKIRRRYMVKKLPQIDKMTGEQFETLLRYHFESIGYKVSMTPRTGDYGADLILYKNGIRTAVQAKRYKDKVSVPAVQEIIAAKAVYKCTQAMVVTNNEFTNNAKKLAAANGVVLWDRATLKKKFKLLGN